MIRHLFALAAALAVSTAAQAYDLKNELPVRVENRSEPVLCAEKDNIDLSFISPDVKSFRIQSVHPAYIGTIVVDKWAPDFTSCDMSYDPSFAGQARRVTFFESTEIWLTGYTFPSFWRPATVPVRVGDRVERGLHVVQLWVRHNERAEEVMAFYPPDGYWRARPLPPPNLRWTAYGSSFLVGPVDMQLRPVVELNEIAFDPKTKTFTLSFKAGGKAEMRIDTLDPDRIVLDVTFDGVPRNKPFASIRSMYVTEANSDTAHVAWRTKGGNAWGEARVLDFKGADATELWTGRMMPSRHNTSAPDTVFSRFSKGLPEPSKPAVGTK